jgi:hypothetical protein
MEAFWHQARSQEIQERGSEACRALQLAEPQQGFEGSTEAAIVTKLQVKCT